MSNHLLPELTDDEMKELSKIVTNPVFKKAQCLIAFKWLEESICVQDGQLSHDSQRQNQARGFAEYPKRLRSLCAPMKPTKTVMAKYSTPVNDNLKSDAIEREQP